MERNTKFNQTSISSFMKMERNFKMLEEMWVYYFSCLPIEEYEYDIYGKIIDKIRKNDFDFTEDDKKNISKLIHELFHACDEYELKILFSIKEHLTKKC